MASKDRAVRVQRVVLVVVAVVLLTLAVVAGLWAGDRNRDADRVGRPRVVAGHPSYGGAQVIRKV